MSLTIRPATKTDLPAIQTLEDELHDYPVDPAVQWKHFEGSDERAVLLAELDGDVVGMVKLNLVFKLSKVMSCLDELVVLPSARGKGAGTKLMRAAEEWSWQHGADIIDFSSREEHSALEFYRKLGYQERDSHLYRKKREGYDGSS
jgi:PhnO protein